MSRPEKRSALTGAPTPTEVARGTPEYGCLIRLIWLVLGSGILFFIWISILSHKGTFFSALDAAFGATVALLIAVRYIDITRLNGQTASGEPATLAHWRRYSVMLLSCGAVAWAVAHAIAYLGNK